MALANFIGRHQPVRRRLPILRSDFNFTELGSYSCSLHAQPTSGQYRCRRWTIQHAKPFLYLTGLSPFFLWLVYRLFECYFDFLYGA